MISSCFSSVFFALEVRLSLDTSIAFLLALGFRGWILTHLGRKGGDRVWLSIFVNGSGIYWPCISRHSFDTLKEAFT